MKKVRTENIEKYFKNFFQSETKFLSKTGNNKTGHNLTPTATQSTANENRYFLDK